MAKKCLSLRTKNYSLRCDWKTSLRKPERSQRRLWGNVFNQSPGRRLRDLQISSLWDVSQTLYETSQRCFRDAFMPAGVLLYGFYRPGQWEKLTKCKNMLSMKKNWQIQNFGSDYLATPCWINIARQPWKLNVFEARIHESNLLLLTHRLVNLLLNQNNTTKYGIKSLRVFRLYTWNNLPEHIKNLNSS